MNSRFRTSLGTGRLSWRIDMAVDEIVRYGNDALRRPTEPVEAVTDEIKELIQRMYKIMRESNGLGLAANQIGISKRLFVYDIGEGPKAVVNPKLELVSGEQLGVEGCLSVPGLQGDVKRANRVVVEGLDEEGNPVRISAEGLLARVFQHETDHLDGYLFLDRADPDSLEFVQATDQSEED